MNWEEFWEYLEYHAAESDSWWLGDWLDERLREYQQTIPCEECGSRFFHSSFKYSKDGNFILANVIYCSKCKTVSRVSPYYREQLREKLKRARLDRMKRALKEPLPKIGTKYE